ncbi:MAG: hypothetical protein LBF66_01330 [Holosporales bacterium]|jgi:hypothetical protein|nr:hypothetical protein [Holosporales bacterium]
MNKFDDIWSQHSESVPANNYTELRDEAAFLLFSPLATLAVRNLGAFA